MSPRIFFHLCCIFGFIFSLSQAASAADFIKAPHIEIDWLAPQSFSKNGQTRVGIRFRMDPHWHVYWKNPGDSGAAPKFKVEVQNGSVGEILWPYPTRLPIAHLMNLGYENETAYFFDVNTKEQSPVELKVHLEWLVCQEECIPGFGELTLSRLVQGQDSKYEDSTLAKIRSFDKKIPISSSGAPYRMTLDTSLENTLKVTITSSTDLPEKIDLFPVDSDYLQPQAPHVTKTPTSYEIVFQKQASAAPHTELSFVLFTSEQAYDFLNLKLAESSKASEPASGAVLLILILSALLGGILLNLMPCVFPVISIKAVSLLNNVDQKSRLQDGLLYTLGVLVTFASPGLVFLTLRYLGSAVGWGFQLQSPLVVFALILLFWMMALNFLGVFELGTNVMNASGRVSWHSSFGTGILSVFIAAPCTGPFMGTALGATATLPGYQAMLIFLFLGFGLALPYLLLTLSPKLAALMPRPGAWMETLKQFFAFPLFATVLWLLWVLGLQTGSQGWTLAGAALLTISFALWLGKRRHQFWRFSAWFLAILLTAILAQRISIAAASVSSTPTNEADSWQNYSEEKLKSALEKHQPVFVDFTAAWCITCQVNKQVVLETAEADKIFTQFHILRLKADWTKQDPVITQALAKLGRNSVPVYAFYSGKNSEPQLLPQILTINMIQNLVPLKEE